MKKIFRTAHLWLSLLFGIFICLLCLSGSILVFENEIKQSLHAELFKATPGERISYESAAQTIHTTYPKGEIQRIYTPDESSSKGVYTFRLKEKNDQLTVYIDPGTGKILGTEKSGGFFGFLTEFHQYLLLKDYKGMDIVGYIGILFIVILLTGIYLWWPGHKKISQGFTIRRTNNQYIKNFDWHRVLGISFIPFLLLVSITGALFPFGQDFLGSLGLKTKVAPSSESLVVHPLASGKVSLDQMINAAENSVSGATVTQIRMPKKSKNGKEEGIEVRLSLPYDPSAASTGNVRVWVNPYNAKIIGKTNAVEDKSFASLYQTWLFPLHTGKFGGLLTQVLYAIGGIVPGILMVTGLVMWRYKAKNKGKNKSFRTNSNERKESQPA